MSTTGPKAFVLEPPPQFLATRDSDRWVRRNIRIQQRYRRVFVVGSEAAAPLRSLRVEALDPNTPSARPAEEYAVNGMFVTLQQAADEARGGDLVAVLPGRYAGMEVGPRPEAGDERYVHFKALGQPGEVVIDAPPAGRSGRAHVAFIGARYVVLQGLNIAGQSAPGLAPVGADAGIRIGGDFHRTGHPTHHIVVIGCFSHHHRSWGLVTSGSHTVLLQDNCFALSCREHSAYVSNGSDHYCIRRNVFFGSSGCGLHCNMDADVSIMNTLAHKLMAHLRPYDPTPEYVRRFNREATAIFGANNYPDGRGLNHLIESNVINDNGRLGGAGINMAGVQDSVVQNNLIYGNANHGIAAFDESGRNIERELVLRLAQDARLMTGPEALTFFGASRNLIRNNTVLLDAPARFAMGMVNGSWGNRLRNNVFINDQHHSIEVSAPSTYGLDSGHNVANVIAYLTVYPMEDSWPAAAPMGAGHKALAVHLDEQTNSTANVTLKHFAPHVERYGQEPWVVLEGGWWRLNPGRPDFRPRAGSTLLAGRGDPAELPDVDLDGQRRLAADIGAYRSA